MIDLIMAPALVDLQVGADGGEAALASWPQPSATAGGTSGGSGSAGVLMGPEAAFQAVLTYLDKEGVNATQVGSWIVCNTTNASTNTNANTSTSLGSYAVLLSQLEG